LRASSRRYHFRLPRRARTFAKVRKDTSVVSHNKPSPARAPPVARSRDFDPGLLLGDQALYELGPVLLVGLGTLRQEQFANLRNAPRLNVCDPLGMRSGRMDFVERSRILIRVCLVERLGKPHTLAGLSAEEAHIAW
jgi:hypothetical protein